MKKAISIIILLILTMTFCSCEKSEEGKRLSVASTYPGLTELVEGEFDAEYAYELANVEHEYTWYVCKVSVDNGKLCITNTTEPNGNKYRNISYPISPGTILTYSIYGMGWIAFVSDSRGLDDVQLITNAQCAAILEPERGTYYVITSNSTDINAPENERSILRLTYDKANDKMVVEKVASLEAYPTWAILSEDKKNIYIVNLKCYTEKGEIKGGILKYDIESGSIEQYKLPEYFGTFAVFPPVEFNGNLYFGAQTGVFEFNLDTQESTWYPVYYHEILK